AGHPAAWSRPSALPGASIRGKVTGSSVAYAGACDTLAAPVRFVSRDNEGDVMATASPWPLIHAERRALADDLSSLDDGQWATPSLCGDWSVRDVLGHMTATARMTPLAFLRGMAGSGFRFNEMNAKNVRKETAGTPAQGLAEFRSLESRTTSP